MIFRAEDADSAPNHHYGGWPRYAHQGVKQRDGIYLTAPPPQGGVA